jgi:hypothetical protein
MPNLFYGARAGVNTSDLGGMRVWKGAAAAAAPWWDPNGEGLCIWAAYQPKGAANFAASLVDISGTGNDAIDPGGAATPGWDAVNGWTFDGIAQYLATTFVPDNDQSQTFICQFTNAATLLPNKRMFGMATNAGTQIWLEPDRGTGTQMEYRHGSSTSNVAPILLAGNLGIAGNDGFRNGVSEGIVLLGFTNPPAHTLYIGAQNVIGVVDFHWQGYMQAFAIYDCTLTALQMLAVATAMAAL